MFLHTQVLYGGGSTLLAVSMLANSESYTFKAFFKVTIEADIILSFKMAIIIFFVFQIFLLVIIFGLFFGLVFLPVILSLLGPAKWHAHSSNEYQIAPTDSVKKCRNKDNEENINEKEMTSFIKANSDTVVEEN